MSLFGESQIEQNRAQQQVGEADNGQQVQSVDEGQSQ